MPQKSLLYIGNKLSKSGITATTMETLGPLLQGLGFKVYSASKVRNKPLRLADMLFCTFRLRYKIDLVLMDTYSTQNFYYAVAVARLCRFFKIPYIPILHGGNLPARLKQNPRLSQKLFGNAKTNVAPSNYLFEAFSKNGFSNLTYIPNALEIKNYPFKSRKVFGAKILWVRSFAEIYNPMLAVRLVENLMAQNIEVSLCMVGPDKDGSLSKCKQFVAERNLPVSFPGKLEKEVWISLSKEYDIFINTSNFDNAPISVLEAMALGLPVISTHVGGLPFLIKNEETGILIAPNDVLGFAKACISLIQNPEKSESLSVKARQMVEGFDWERIKDSWAALLNQ